MGTDAVFFASFLPLRSHHRMSFCTDTGAAQRQAGRTFALRLDLVRHNAKLAVGWRDCQSRGRPFSLLSAANAAFPYRALQRPPTPV
jgi:hypothetical protein